MSDITACIPTDRLVLLVLTDGTPLPGRVHPLRDEQGVTVPGWIEVINADGTWLVQLAHVVRIDLQERLAEAPIVERVGQLPRPISKDRPGKVGSKAPGRPWTDDDLRAVADGFLDNKTDPDLSEQFHRTRSQIRDLRQAFECNRGNLTDDEINPAATTWVDRWQRVLRSS